METKTTPISDCEIKQADDGWTFEGYASKFDGVDSYNDTIHKGAYTETLKNRSMPVMMRYEHRAGALPPGKWIKIGEDDVGLPVVGELTRGMSLSTDIKAAMEHGTLNGLSIGYRIPKGGAEEVDGVRHIKKIDLVEISIVQNPADSGAQVTGMKAEIESLDSLKDFEWFLRDAEGQFSRATAKCFISRLKSFVERDASAEMQKEIAQLKEQLTHKSSADRLASFIRGL